MLFPIYSRSHKLNPTPRHPVQAAAAAVYSNQSDCNSGFNLLSLRFRGLSSYRSWLVGLWWRLKALETKRLLRCCLSAAGREAFCEPHRYANDDRIFVFVRHESSMGPYSSSFATTSSSPCWSPWPGFTRGRSPCITRLNKLIDKNHGQLHRGLPFWLKTRTRWGRRCRNRLNL